jgi:hypothetical protein
MVIQDACEGLGIEASIDVCTSNTRSRSTIDNQCRESIIEVHI